MMRTAARYAALLEMCWALCGASSPFGGKPYGVILLGENGGGAGFEWKSTTSDAIKALGSEHPAVFANGLSDVRSIQKAVDLLTAQRVEKIVAVPLSITTFSDDMDQARYVFGIRENPVLGQSNKRVKTKKPLILAKGLDDHPLVVEILASRAAALARAPGKETLVLVGQAPEDKEVAAQWVATVTSLAEKVARKAGMVSGHAMALRQDLRSEARDKAEKEVRDALKALRKQGGVVVVPLELAPGFVRHRLPQLLEGGAMVRYNGKTILPDPRMARWIVETADAASKLPDMKQFTKESMAKPQGLSQPSRIDSKPTLHNKGDHL